MKLFGEKVTIAIRKHTPDTSGMLGIFAGVLANLYGTRLKVEEQQSNCEWEMPESLAKRGEKATRPRIHTRQLMNEDDKQMAVAIKAQNTEKRFDRSIQHCKENRPVSATVWPEAGIHGEFGYAVYVQHIYKMRRCHERS
jgi:hypothetical protein